MTNETVVAYTFVGFPNVFADPTKVDRAKVGYGYQVCSITASRRFHRSANLAPAKLRWCSILADSKPAEPSQGLYANKYMPSVSDTLTKVIRNHTLKAGFFYEWIRNAQPANNNTNGLLQVSAGN